LTVKIARVGLIDRSSSEVSSCLDVSLHACHLRLVNGHALSGPIHWATSYHFLCKPPAFCAAGTLCKVISSRSSPGASPGSGTPTYPARAHGCLLEQGRSSRMIKHLRAAQPPRPDGSAPGQVGRAVPGDCISRRGGSQTPVRLRQTGISKTMINRWSAGTSVEAIPGGRERRSESYRTLTFGGEGEGKPRAGACRLPMVARPGPSHFAVTSPMLVRWLTPDDEPRRSRSRTRPRTPTVQTLEKRPNTATLCHFWGRPVRHLGGEYRDSSRSGTGV
jgi:hypothetical protein